MRGSTKVFTLASIALLSCRAVLGIEEIEDGTSDGGTGTPDAAADSVGTDSANVVDSGPDTGCAPSADCNVCCRKPLMGSQALPELEKVAIKAGCICGDAGLCATDCAPICNNTGMPQPSCIQCLDTALLNGAKLECGKALDDCVANTTCKPMGECLRGCKP
jgi:hypothetical protein